MPVSRVNLQVVQHLRPGGLEAMALDLMRYSSAVEENYIVSLEGTLDEAIQRWPRLHAHQHRLKFLNKQPGFEPSLLQKLSKVFREFNATSVHTHHIGPLLYGGLAARAAGIPIVVHTEHDAWHLCNNKRRRLQRAVLRIVRPLLVADAQAVAEGVQSQLGLEDVSIIRNGIDTERFVPGDTEAARSNFGLPSGVRLVGTAGRLEPVKGHRDLIEAIRRLPERVHLAIAGNGSQMNSLRNLSRQPGLFDRIHFLGRVDNMPAFYQALDVFCLPSYSEGMPLAPMEAQACGIPTVATDTGGTAEAVCPRTGSLVPVGNTEALASALSRSLDTSPGESPRHFAERYCDVRAMTEAYAALRAA